MLRCPAEYGWRLFGRRLASQVKNHAQILTYVHSVRKLPRV